MKKSKTDRNYPKEIVILLFIGIAKLIVCAAAFCICSYFDMYNQVAFSFINLLFSLIVLFEGWNFFAGQPIVVLILSALFCRKRQKEETMQKRDVLLALVNVIVWIASAVLLYFTSPYLA